MKENQNQPHCACPRDIRWLLLFAYLLSIMTMYFHNSCWFEIQLYIMNLIRLSFGVHFLLLDLNWIVLARTKNRSKRKTQTSYFFKGSVYAPDRSHTSFLLNLFCSYSCTAWRHFPSWNNKAIMKVLTFYPFLYFCKSKISFWHRVIDWFKK